MTDVGLDIICNNLESSPNPCTLIAGDQYCASLEGTPTNGGVYQMTLEVEAWANCFGCRSSPHRISSQVTFWILSASPVEIARWRKKLNCGRYFPILRTNPLWFKDSLPTLESKPSTSQEKNCPCQLTTSLHLTYPSTRKDGATVYTSLLSQLILA